MGKVRDRELAELKAQQTKAKRSLTYRGSRYEGYAEAVGFDTELLGDYTGSSLATIRKAKKEINAYLKDKGNRLVTLERPNEETGEIGSYTIKSKWDIFAKDVRETQKYRERVREAFEGQKRKYQTKKPSGAITEREGELNLGNVTDLVSSYIVFPSGIMAGKPSKYAEKTSVTINYERYITNRIKGIEARKQQREVDVRSNYLRGVRKKFGDTLANRIERKFKKLHVSPEEFMYLFYKYESFNISFIYSETDIDDKMEIIESEVKALRRDKDGQFADFNKKIGKTLRKNSNNRKGKTKRKRK